MSLFILYNLSQAGILSPTQGRCAHKVSQVGKHGQSFSALSPTLSPLTEIPWLSLTTFLQADTPYLSQHGPCVW